MAGGPVQPQPSNMRREYLLIPPLRKLLGKKLLHFLTDNRPIRRPHHQSRPHFVVDEEQIQFPPQFPVVSQLRLLDLLQIGLQLILFRERRPIEPLKLGILLVAPVIRPGHGEQLEGLHLARALHMSPGTQIGKLTVAVETNRLTLRDVGQPPHLKDLSSRFEPLPGLISAHFLADKRLIFLGHLGHLRLDLGKVLLREAVLQLEVVVEPCLRRRADIQSGIRP